VKSVVGIGELSVARGDDATLRTYSLGSCVAVVVVDRVRSVIGLAHVVLPESDPDARARMPEAYFADVAVKTLLDGLAHNGSGPRMGPLHVVLVGGGTAGRTGGGVFNIGARNVDAVRRALTELRVGVVAEDVGGAWSRTVLVTPRDIVVTCPDRPSLHL
jgi:chemotaxis protein CheD